MRNRPLSSKLIAWSLIAAMANPAMMWPAYGRDSDIYLSVSNSSTTAEPNIMIMLDTSDTMNLPEAWKEYPGAYDSHVEYLWNDATFVNTGAEQTTASTTRISTAAATVLTVPGSWEGSTLAARQALWNAAKTYLQATEPGDPGPRSTYRNYNDHSWIYWLPAGTADSDARLRAPSFSRFRGAIDTIGGNRGGIIFTATTDFRGFNRCRDSGIDPAVSLGHVISGSTIFGTGQSSTFDPTDPTLPQGLTPSTVYAPSAAPRNSGRYLNQQWVRYERALDLRNGKFVNGDAPYPLTGVGAPLTPAAGTNAIGAGSGTGNTGSTISANNEYISANRRAPTAVRDSYPNIPPFGSITNIGSQGQPIRTPIDSALPNIVTPGDSRSGWTLPKADMGGFIFASTVNSMTAAVITSVLSTYGIAVGGNNAKSVAWKGNRDASPSFDVTTGTPAYWDTSGAIGATIAGNANIIGAPSRLVVGDIINVVGTTVNMVTTVTAVSNNTITMAAPATAADVVTVTKNLRLVTAPGTTVCTRTCTLDANPGTAGNQAAILDTAGPDGTNTSRSYALAGATCVSTNVSGSNCTTAPAACAAPAPGANYVTANYAGCAWSGRQSLYVEGVGTYYYGGTCGAAATCRGVGNLAGGSECVASSNSTTTYGSSSYVARSYCTVSGVSNLTVGSTQMAGAVLNNATSGCGNRAQVTRTAPTRPIVAAIPASAPMNPAGSFYGPTCTNTTVSSTNTTTDYAVFNVAGADNNLVHDCIADNATAGNPLSGYIANRTDIPFNTAFNVSVSTAAGSTGSYSSLSGQAMAGAAIDTYSVNWLNWKFGPKGPNGHPIGRKTRLQIAKDALTTLVRTTDGVRFGLAVFNRTAGCTSSVGLVNVNVAPVNPFDPPIAPNILTLSDNPGFVIGQNISIAGAGAAGATLNTSITNIQPNNNVPPGDPPKVDVTLAAAATTNVIDTQVNANPCSGAISNEGGNIAQRILRMGSNSTDLPDYNNRATLINAINSAVAASRTPITETLYEIYRYFSGRVPRFGTSSVSAVVGGTVTTGRDVQAVCSAVSADCPAIGLYRSPMLNNPNTTSPAGCQKNFVIVINDGTAEDDWGANTDIKRMSYAGVLGTVSPRTTIDAANADTVTDQFESSGVRYGNIDTGSTTFDGGYIWLDELAYFMSRADVSPGATNLPGDAGPDRLAGRQSVVTYTIGFAGASSPVLQNASAQAGGGYYQADNSAALGAALLAALVAIRAWNPTAAAPTVPISALNRSENASDVYLAFFQPDPSSAWLGTVKKFQLSSSSSDCGPGISLCLIGQTLLTKLAPNPSPVKNIETVTVDPVTNTQEVAVDPNASSFWAPSTVTDGSHPDQGGTGYQLLNAGMLPRTRNVYTFLTGTASSVDLTHTSNALKENNNSITKTLLGNVGMSDALRSTLINFARGGNPSDANCSDSSLATNCDIWRAWPHGAVEHSKPIVVQYPANQYLLYLSNDGMLHAVDTANGQEQWAFMIEEALPQINTIMADNAGPELTLADGGLALWHLDTNANGKVDAGETAWLYFGLRRGGRVYYALDIASRDTPMFKWKITANSGSGRVCLGLSACAGNADYNELGQTWSTPQVVKIRALGASTPALIFGGGYDPNQDGVPPAATADTMGRAVYVVNGDTADVVKWFGFGGNGTMLTGSMTHSVPSDVNPLNTDNDAQGFIDRVYVGDTGGFVWRFDIDSATTTNWRGSLLADLSGGTTPARKIFFPPPAVKQNVPERFDGVYVGTGDREHPLSTSTTTPATAADKIFMIMDRDTGLMASGGAAATFPNDFLAIGNTSTTGIATASLTTKKGWYRDLDDGEKVINPPTVFFQKLRFGTYAPLSQTNACTPAGEGRLNEIDALTGDLFNLNSGDPLNAGDRYYSSFVTRGYISTGQLIIQGRNIFHITVSDARLQSILIGTIGSASKIYWYMEPEQ